MTRVECPDCRGLGATRDGRPAALGFGQRCDRCEGHGMVDSARVGGQMRQSVRERIAAIATHHCVDGWERMTLLEFAEECARAREGKHTRSPIEWHNDPANVLELFDWLRKRGDGPCVSLSDEEMRELRYGLGKPWKWSTEYAEMIREKCAGKLEGE